MSLTSADPGPIRAAAPERVVTQTRNHVTADVRRLAWPLRRLGEGLEELSRRAGLAINATEPLVMPADVARDAGDECNRWIAWAADRLGIEAEPVTANVPDVAHFLLTGGPAILRFTDPDGPRFLLLLKSRFGRPQLIGPDLRVRGCALDTLRALLAATAELRVLHDIEGVLDLADVPARRRAKATRFMLDDRLKSTAVSGFLVLRSPASAPFAGQLRQARIAPRMAGMAALFGVVYLLEMLGWVVIGDAALNGRIDFGWLAGWVLLVLSVIPLKVLAGSLSVAAAVDLGRLLKQRLLAGCLSSDMESVRRTGAGRLLARVMESQAFEALAFNGGFSAVIALVELCFAFWLVSLGAGGALHVLLLLAWVALSLTMAFRFHARLSAWTAQRGLMTHTLVERMIGHRTILAQERAEQREATEDQGLKDYIGASRGLDGAATPFLLAIPAGWTMIGLAGLAPAFVAGTASPSGLAIGLGGVLVAGRALSGLCAGASAAARAVIAWREIGPLFKAARREPGRTPFVPLATASSTRERPARPAMVDVEGLVFRYAGRDRPVLDHARLRIEHGERVLLQGRSGGGKSTLTSLLTGLRRPDAGLLLLDGLDRETLGGSWRDFASQAPQFHENHVLSGPFAFNLLMGRRWPARAEDLAEAREVCEELGLGDLIERMPGGLMQMIGETGWQLSHGERSRLFLARALLQDAPLTILDESFAALDPETLEMCLKCAFRRAKTLIVVAHP